MAQLPDQLQSQYEQARRGAALFDLANYGNLEVKGPDAASFLHNLCTNDVRGLAVGAGCEAFLITAQAKIVAHVFIHRTSLAGGGESFVVDVGPDMAEKALRHLDRYLISEQVELSDLSGELGQAHLAGPEAARILEQAFGMTVTDLGNLRNIVNEWRGAPYQVRRNDRLGLPGYDLVVPRTKTSELLAAVTSTGAVPAAPEVFEILRLEAGTPLYGKDIDDSNLPQEVARIDRTISFTKGCYIGQETVARIRTYGHVNRSLVGLRLPEGEPPVHGTKLFQEGKEVGLVTSSVFSPAAGSAVALGYVRRGFEKPGTRLEVEVAGMRQMAEVAPLPLAGSSPPSQ